MLVIPKRRPKKYSMLCINLFKFRMLTWANGLRCYFSPCTSLVMNAIYIKTAGMKLVGRDKKKKHITLGWEIRYEVNVKVNFRDCVTGM